MPRGDVFPIFESQKQVDMAKTSYRDCWWLIQVLTGQSGQGSFRDGTGYDMHELVDYLPIGRRFDWVPSNEIECEDDQKNKDAFRKILLSWRAIIYNEFGLVTLMDSTSGSDKHGNGGYYYYLMNPELLDENGKTLRDHIAFLANSETNRDNWISVKKMTKMYKGSSSSMGFLSAGSSNYGFLSASNTTVKTILGEENLELVQFAMQFGEVLTIKYGKVKAGVDINDPYSFEPYQVKEIEGRWYAIGNLYPVGHKESAEVAVYDLSRLEFSDAENPDVLFEPVKDFDVDTYINRKLQVDGAHPINQCLIVRIMFKVSPGYEKDIQIHPLSSAQTFIPSRGRFYMYKNFTHDLVVQAGAYGDELRFFVGVMGRMDLYKNTIIEALTIFRETPKEELLHHDHETYEG